MCHQITDKHAEIYCKYEARQQLPAAPVQRMAVTAMRGVNLGFKSLLICFLLLTFGCASTGPNLRADPKLLEANLMQNIAIVGYGKVVWPGRTGNAIIGVQSSKDGIETVIEHIEAILTAKGYRIAFAEPIAVGYPNPGKEQKYYVNYDELGDSDSHEISAGEFAHEYPIDELPADAHAAAVELLRSIEEASLQPEYIDPEHTHVATIAGVTGVDTICVVRTFGRRFTSARAVGEAAISFALALFGGVNSNNTTDSGWTGLICYSAADAHVIWSRGFVLGNDPMEATYAAVESGLKLMPVASEPLDAKCKLWEDKPDRFLCP